MASSEPAWVPALQDHLRPVWPQARVRPSWGCDEEGCGCAFALVFPGGVACLAEGNRGRVQPQHLVLSPGAVPTTERAELLVGLLEALEAFRMAPGARRPPGERT